MAGLAEVRIDMSPKHVICRLGYRGCTVVATTWTTRGKAVCESCGSKVDAGNREAPDRRAA